MVRDSWGSTAHQLLDCYCRYVVIAVDTLYSYCFVGELTVYKRRVSPQDMLGCSFMFQLSPLVLICCLNLVYFFSIKSVVILRELTVLIRRVSQRDLNRLISDERCRSNLLCYGKDGRVGPTFVIMGKGVVGG